MQTIYSSNGRETQRIDTQHSGHYVAFSGKQVLGYDTNDDRLMETLMEAFDPERFTIVGVTQRVIDAIDAGEDCLDVTCVETGFFGKVYDIR